MSVEALKQYTLRAKYARYNRQEKRRETYAEATNRVRNMMLGLYPQVTEEINQAYDSALAEKVLGSQRALQFGGKPALQHNARVFNCCASFCDRLRFFQEAFYLLLCGCGTGFSVQKHHIAKLPAFSRLGGPFHPGEKTFVIPDTIEGWSDALGVLLSSYFTNGVFPEYEGYYVNFDYSLIRLEGSYLSSGAGKAPGPDPLRRALEKIRALLDRCVASGREKLRPIDAYDIVMHASDAVLAGGVRRSATICVFSLDDMEMMTAKTGNWFVENPQRARSNNSVLLLRNKTSYNQFQNILQYITQWGEPGFLWSDSTEQIINPCAEISFWPRLMLEATAKSTRELLTCYHGPIDYAQEDPAFEGRFVGNNTILVSGWNFCNLCTINGSKCEAPEDFYNNCEDASIIGTCQAGMTKLPYLGPVTELIVEGEALLGVSITAVMDNPHVLLDPEVLREGARIVVATNERIAQKIGINPCARATCMKPEGTGTLMLGSLACGLRPWHAKKVLRRVQANRNEPVAKFFREKNPWAVEKSVWCQNGTTDVLTFCVDAPPGAIIQDDVDAIQFLKYVETVVDNWIRPGKRQERCTQPWLTHNVSNTVTVRPEEWEDVGRYIYDHRENFAGVSLLAYSGDKDYPQAPFTAVYNHDEIEETYGKEVVDAAKPLLKSALNTFDNDVWKACEHLLTGDVNGDLERNTLLTVCRAFADTYLNGDVRRLTYILKDLDNLNRWEFLRKAYRPVNYDELIEDEDSTVPMAEVACAGGACSL